MGEHNDALNLATVPPAVILMAGLQGAGKTTTSGKLAKLLHEQNRKKVLLVSCDVYRPAAIEQLRTLAEQLKIDFFASDISQKPLDIALAAHDYARKHHHDILIVDTAGTPGDRRRDDGGNKKPACRAEADRDAVCGRCDDRPGRGQHGQGFWRRTAADRHHPHQAGWRRARRRRPVGALHHRQADQVCRRQRKDERPQPPPRAHGLARAGHGRRAVADRGRAAQRGRGRSREICEEGAERQGLRPQRLQDADRADAQNGRRLRDDGKSCPPR